MQAVKAFARKMSTSNGSSRNLVAVCQLKFENDPSVNFNTCTSMIKRAHERNCKMVFFPECFDYIGRNREETTSPMFPDNGPYLEKFRKLAKESGVWLSLGGFQNKSDNCDKLPLNTHLIINSDGKDLKFLDKPYLMESEFSRAGDRLVPPVETPIGKLGLSICYDVRFPEIGLWNRQNGAEILSYPSAFNSNDGIAHWKEFLRSRAIETQCYVVAAAQIKKSNEKKNFYDRSMVVDPRGVVVAQCSDTVNMCFAEINLDYLKEVRLNQPVMNQRRPNFCSIMHNTISKSKVLKVIEKSKPEEEPKTLVGKVKFYVKRYWYIAIPVHTVNCSIWFAVFYLAVRSGVDIAGLMETLHMPDSIVAKIKSVPKGAGHIVVALILYKIALPLRYATTLAALRFIFHWFKR